MTHSTETIIDTVNNHLFMLSTMRNECGIYINTTAPNLGNPKTAFIIQFGKHHLALFSLLNKIHYNMWRINGQHLSDNDELVNLNFAPWARQYDVPREARTPVALGMFGFNNMSELRAAYKNKHNPDGVIIHVTSNRCNADHDIRDWRPKRNRMRSSFFKRKK